MTSLKGNLPKFLSLLLMGALVAACSRAPEQSDEARVRAQLEVLVQAVEDGSAGDIQNVLAEDFAGPSGMDRARTRSYASLMLRRYPSPSVQWSVDEMDVQGDRARVRASVLVTGRTQASGLGFSGRWMDVEMGWRLDGRDWMLVSARWSGKIQ